MVCLRSRGFYLTHWGIYASVQHITIASDNGLSPVRHQAIIWRNAGILLIGPLGTNFSEILIEIHKFLFKKMHLKMSAGKCRPFCLGLNVLSSVQSNLLITLLFCSKSIHKRHSMPRTRARGLECLCEFIVWYISCISHYHAIWISCYNKPCYKKVPMLVDIYDETYIKEKCWRKTSNSKKNFGVNHPIQFTHCFHNRWLQLP